jgi:phage tail sheath gpL-like
MPYTDTANLNALRDELVSRWSATRMIDGMAFTAMRGDYSTVSTFGGTRNDFLVTCMDAGESPTPAYIWAAVNAAVAAGSLSIDPARPLQTLALPGLLPAAIGDRRTLIERDLLLHDGISTNTVDAGGNVLIERQITTYQTNALGAPDPSYLDVNTPATLSYLRYSTRTRIQLRFPRFKLADNGTPIAPGQAIVTPNIIKAELIALATEWVDAGLIENLDTYKKNLVVERNANDRNRVDVLAPPDLINQFRIFAEQIQFIL